jgi:hypothetical protein
VDRDRGNEHIGSLLLVTPSRDCEGGALYSGTDRLSAAKGPYIAFIPLGFVHHVDKVTRGSRLVAKASVHTGSVLPALQLLQPKPQPKPGPVLMD